MEGYEVSADVAKLKYRIAELEQERDLLMAKLEHYRGELFKNLSILLDGRAEIDLQMKKNIDARKKMSAEITRLNEQISAERTISAERPVSGETPMVVRAV